MHNIDAVGFRIFLGVLLGAIAVLPFCNRKRPLEEQRLLCWPAGAGFVTGFIATQYVVYLALSLCALALLAVLILLSIQFASKLEEAQSSGQGLSSEAPPRTALPGPFIRDLRQALSEGDVGLAEETLNWWESRRG